MKRTVPVFRPWLFLRVGALCCSLLAAGCHSPQDDVTSANNSAALPGSGGVDTYRVRAATTSFFHISPLQASGADEQLKKDTEVTMIKASRTYSRVKIAGGDTGYVATEDLVPLTSQEIAAAAAAANAGSVQAQLENQRQAAARSMGGDGYTIPPEAGNQEKLPEPDVRPTGSPGPKANAGTAPSPTPDPLFHH